MPSLPRPGEIPARYRVDLPIAVVLLGWALADVPWPWRPPGHGGTAAAVCGYLALGLVQSVPSLWRRRVPAAALALACAAVAVRTAMGLHRVSAVVALAAAGYSFGAYGETVRRHARPLLAAAAVAAVAAAVSYRVREVAGLPGVVLGAAVVAGDAAASRRDAAEAAVEAAHLAERTRIARELHDVLAHQLAAITVQAGAARLALSARAQGAGERGTGAAGAGTPGADRPDDGEPGAESSGEVPEAGVPGVGPRETAVRVLAGIERLSREALTELGHLLGALRREPDPGAERRPVPCLAEVPSLVATARGAGTAVGLTVVGPARPLSPGGELSAYRIVQEALTNVVRHAPGASAEVSLRYLPDRLEVSVVNGRPPSAGTRTAPPPAAGRGLTGMRERAELHGGRLTVTTPPGGGLSVLAELPYAEPEERRREDPRDPREQAGQRPRERSEDRP
ncbi:sensor histidine kinase [Streptomyces sp. HPF1205]|uniref:sensor histidine kinase n=1 Tax=Streptomyces sp. HPF1205 TaxID=2873262 RepID=UPI001CED0B3F|nr:histidine kinase [Streptomyces sp. HPF1205]